MAYTAWSVVFGEQPTAAKWNQLGENDAGFKTGDNIDSNAIIGRHILEGSVTQYDGSDTSGDDFTAGTAQTVSSPATSTWYDVTDATETITTTGGAVLILFTVMHTTSASFDIVFRGLRDSTFLGKRYTMSDGTGRTFTTFFFDPNPSAASHTYKIQVGKVGSGALTSISLYIQKAFEVIELKK